MRENNNYSNMSTLEVGQVIPGFKGQSEGVRFDMTDTGAVLVVCFNNPTENEIEQFRNNHRFEIRFVTLKNVIMLTVKVGDLNWMDAPYTVHLSKQLTEMPVIEDGIGIGLTLILVDTLTGQVKSMRLLGLSTKFSVALCKEIDKQRKENFTEEIYDINLSRIYSSYKTTDIVKFSSNYCKIN